MNLEKALWYLKTQLTKFQYGSIGKHSYIGTVTFVQRKKHLYIGNNVRIYPGMRAELTKESARIVVEDNVSIGQNLHVVSYQGALNIGRNTTISGNVFVSNVDHDYREIGIHVLNQGMLEKETLIGENCFIGYGAVIMPGTKLGKQCIVGANAVVCGDFPDDCVIAGVPAKIVKKYNEKLNEWIKV
ncbi:MAG TPA: lipopolysaccharide biosynthesis protein [Lachnoclostridium sp.]|nr:lipopolysaccharide biosynthesis protein [Lachnoclostridium sp.]